MQRTEVQLYLGQHLGGRYEVLAFRGSGAFSGVFRALDNDNGREVAAKILSLRSSMDVTAVQEFEEERRLLAMLSHCSNIVELVDFGQHSLQIHATGGLGPIIVPVPFMVLEYADGTLAELLVQRHQIAWTERLSLYRDVVLGAHQMHVERVVHRDIKTENTLLVGNGGVTAKLSDLGRSKDTRQPQLAPHQAYQVGRGDPRFAPPEYLWMIGEGDHLAQIHADLYLLGSVLFELATGVGLTSFVLGDPRLLQSQAAGIPDERDRVRQYRSTIGSLRERYEIAYETFRAELPGAIASEATALLRQLTDPEPAARRPRQPFQGLPLYWDLQWLIRRVDILRARLAVPKSRSRLPWKAGRK